jgi:hypothetical protein
LIGVLIYAARRAEPDCCRKRVPTDAWVGLHIMAERGQNTAGDMIVKTYTRRAGALLRHYRERGSVRSIKDPRGGQFDLWEVAG